MCCSSLILKIVYRCVLLTTGKIKMFKTDNLYRRAGCVFDKQQSAVFSDDGVRRRPTVDNDRTAMRSGGRLSVAEIGNQSAALDARTIAFGDEAADRRADSDERQQAACQLRGQVLGRRADVQPRSAKGLFDEPRVLRLAEGEVLQQFVEGARAALVIQPRIVVQHVVVEVRGAFCRRQVERQVTEFTHVVPGARTTAVTCLYYAVLRCIFIKQNGIH